MKLAAFGSRAIAFALLAGCGGSAVADSDPPEPCGEALSFYSPGGACYSPGECCDLGGTDLPAHCQAAFPGHPVPVMCMDDMPAGLDCQRLETSQFMCEWGSSALTCCQTSE